MTRDMPRVLELSKDLWFELDKRFSVGGDMGSGQTPPQTVHRLELLECSSAMLGLWLASTSPL